MCSLLRYEADDRPDPTPRRVPAWSRRLPAGPLRIALPILGLLLLPGGAVSQWAGWTARWENDTFAAGPSSDSGYTNGLHVTLRAERDWSWARSLTDLLGLEAALFGEGGATLSNSLIIGQEVFTPRLITAYVPDPSDRPYAGLLHAGTRIDLTGAPPPRGSPGRRWQHSLGASVGILGRGSLAENLQKSTHVLLSGEIPKGWGHALATEPALGLVWASRVSLGAPLARGMTLDLTPHGGLELGTVQTFATLGGTLRIGTIDGFPTAFGAPTSRRPRPSAVEGELRWSVEGAYEYRTYLHNAYAEGGLLRDGVPLESREVVGELRLGATLGYRDWTFSYAHVRRGEDVDGPGGANPRREGQSFGTLMVARDLARNRPSSDSAPWWTRDWLLEVSVGSGESREAGDTGLGPGRAGPSARVAAAKGITETILLGLEFDAVGYEHGPPDETGLFVDDYYVIRALTLGWRPWGRDRLLVVRGGAGLSAVRTRETVVRDFTQVRRWMVRDQSRLGLVAGASYGFPLGESASLGVDASVVEIPGGGPGEPRVSYVSWGVGVKWHP